MKEFTKTNQVRSIILILTLLLSCSNEAFAEVRLFENAVASNDQGDKWIYAEDNGLYGVYFNDECLIPLEYKNIRFFKPFFFVEDSEGKQGVYWYDGTLALPIEKGDLTMRADLRNLIVRARNSKDMIIYDFDLKPAIEIKEWVYGAYPEFFIHATGEGQLVGMKDLYRKWLIPAGYGIEHETKKVVETNSNSIGIEIEDLKLLDKDGVPLANRKFDNITIALIDNELSMCNSGFSYCVVKNYDRTESKIPKKNEFPTIGFCFFPECEFTYGTRNNFPYFKVVADDGLSFIFEKNRITIENQEESICFVPEDIDNKELKEAIDKANEGDFSALFMYNLGHSGTLFSSIDLTSSIHFKSIWDDFIEKAKKYNWKKVTYVGEI